MLALEEIRDIRRNDLKVLVLILVKSDYKCAQKRSRMCINFHPFLISHFFEHFSISSNAEANEKKLN